MCTFVRSLIRGHFFEALKIYFLVRVAPLHSFYDHIITIVSVVAWPLKDESYFTDLNRLRLPCFGTVSRIWG